MSRCSNARTRANLVVNEMAPRVHNSGHWTIDACLVSQFENHIRAIAGWPLGETSRHSDAVMTNLIGDDVNRWPKLAAAEGTCLHLYGKAEARPGRKMGHYTRIVPEAHRVPGLSYCGWTTNRPSVRATAGCGTSPVRSGSYLAPASTPNINGQSEIAALQVVVRDNNVDQALRALKKKMQREGIFREMKLRNYYEKPSEKRAREKAEAIRRARKLARKKAQREGLIAARPQPRVPPLVRWSRRPPLDFPECS